MSMSNVDGVKVKVRKSIKRTKYEANKLMNEDEVYGAEADGVKVKKVRKLIKRRQKYEASKLIIK